MPENRSQRAEDAIGPHRIVCCLAVTSTCEIDQAITYGPFGFQRDVVLKRILAGLEDEELDRAAGRLLREAAVLARLSHPAIVRLYELTEHEGLPVLVLEHVDGPSLASLLDVLDASGAPLDEGCALYVGYRVFCALDAAHRACDPTSGAPLPIVHGDVAPSNVLVPWDGHVKLADFDLSSGHGPGTPGFVAPERLRGGSASTRSDVFSACLLVRELLLRAGGVCPTDAPLSKVCPWLDPALVDALDRGLSPDPRARTVSAAEVATRLLEVVDVEAARERLSRHMAGVARTPSDPRVVAARPAAARVESPPPSVEVDVDLEMDEEPDVRLGPGVAVAVAVTAMTPVPQLTPRGPAAPAPISTLRPTAMSLPPRSSERDRGALSSLRTVKSARRRRQRAAWIGAVVAGTALGACCALLVLAKMRGGASFPADHEREPPPVAATSAVAIPPAQESSSENGTALLPPAASDVLELPADAGALPPP